MNSAVIWHAERAISQMPRHNRADRELSRLIGAALINPAFCRLLLIEPAKAIEIGFNGDAFRLAPEDYALVTLIRANSLEDFARQVVLGRGAERSLPTLSRAEAPTTDSYLSGIVTVGRREMLSA